jgi:hypothetical protein
MWISSLGSNCGNDGFFHDLSRLPGSPFSYNSPICDNQKHPQDTPSRYVTPVYSTYTQYTTRNETPPLTAKQCLKIQKVTASVLYYARAVDPAVFMTLNIIATEQTKATEKKQSTTDQLLYYMVTHPDATISYHASDMILQIHNDPSYLSVSHARIVLSKPSGRLSHKTSFSTTSQIYARIDITSG